MGSLDVSVTMTLSVFGSAEPTTDLDQLRKAMAGRRDEEYQAKIERAAKYICDIVESWDSETHRRTMLLMLDAASLLNALWSTPSRGRRWTARCFNE